MSRELELYPIRLDWFDGETAAAPDPNTQVTTQESLSAENKTFYERDLIELASAELVHDQFAQKRPIPRGSGKTIEFRRFDKLPEMTTPLVEGVTPDGQSLSVSAITATVQQYGGYVTYSDMLDLQSLDPVVIEANKAIARQAGETLDTITRDILAAGTVVQYARGNAASPVASRAALHYTSAANNCNVTVDDIRRAVRYLEGQDAPRIGGSYVAIIHPNVKYDLLSDTHWLYPHQYQDTTNIYRNEIGELYGVRFVESTRAKVFAGAGASGVDVYATLIMGADAYGVTEITGGGLELIIKQLGSSGAADPLNQRATIGWKATKTAELLIPQYLVRVESTATP